jgi:hypothetical protein
LINSRQEIAESREGRFLLSISKYNNIVCDTIIRMKPEIDNYSVYMVYFTG